jgi:hypothetical protein
MLASVELKKRENRDDIDFFSQMNGYVPCGIQQNSYIHYNVMHPMSITSKI